MPASDPRAVNGPASLLDYVRKLIAQRSDPLMKGCYAPSCIAVILAPYGAYIALVGGGFYWALGWMLAFLLFGWWLGARLQHYSDRIYSGLKRSCFIMRLAGGPQELDAIYRELSRISALILLGPPPNSFQAWARMVVKHIDYYAMPEQSFVARAMQFAFSVIVPPLVSFAGGLLMSRNLQMWGAWFHGIMLGLITLILVAVHARAMRAASFDALERYLKYEMQEELI